MKDSLFRDWDNGNKYVKSVYQGAPAKIGHLEYLYDYLKENTLSDWTTSTEGYNVGEVVYDTNGLYRNTLENNASQPSVNSPSNGWTLLTGTPYEPSYKVYTALLIQIGTQAPSIFSLLENTIGVTPVFTYNGVGDYTVTMTGALTLSKTTVEYGGVYTSTTGASIHTPANSLNVNSFKILVNNAGTPANSILNRTKIEIRVYE